LSQHGRDNSPPLRGFGFVARGADAIRPYGAEKFGQKIFRPYAEIKKQLRCATQLLFIDKFISYENKTFYFLFHILGLLSAG
jgi:hypothetical protein